MGMLLTTNNILIKMITTEDSLILMRVSGCGQFNLWSSNIGPWSGCGQFNLWSSNIGPWSGVPTILYQIIWCRFLVVFLNQQYYTSSFQKVSCIFLKKRTRILYNRTFLQALYFRTKAMNGIDRNFAYPLQLNTG